MQPVRIAAVVLFIWSSVSQAQNLTTAQAKAHMGESATVCGTVAVVADVAINHRESNSRWRLGYKHKPEAPAMCFYVPYLRGRVWHTSLKRKRR